MTVSPKGIALICHFEGCKLEAYRDASPAKTWTIGYGHTGAGVSPGLRIDQERAAQLLADDLAVFERAVSGAVHVPLDQPQFDALVSFAYNVKGWRESPLIHTLNTGDYEATARKFPLYAHAGAETLPGLVLRRAAEQRRFRGQQWDVVK